MKLMVLVSLGEFIGRFHPLVVHLPIGFFVLAILLEWFQKDSNKNSQKMVAFSWLLSALSATAASFCGWLLAASGSYPEQGLFWHRWMGILLSLISFGMWWIKKNPSIIPKKSHAILNVFVLLLLTLAGHQGGNLTHGSGYLTEHAPGFIQKITGTQTSLTVGLPQISDPDSALVYQDLIQPIFAQKCMACHNDEVQRGGLNMATPEKLLAGGNGGPVLVAGNARESEIFKRLLLPHTSEKHMPTKGEPMTFQEIQMLEWWIEEDASFENKASDLPIPDRVKPILASLYRMDTEPKPWYEKVKIAPAPVEVLAQLAEESFTIRQLSAENHLLEVSFNGNTISQEQLEQLAPLKAHITWLDLADKGLQDEGIELLGSFSNLTRLRIQQNPISDQGLSYLQPLTHLASLNVFGTELTDASLETIRALPALEKVYLWQTEVSQSAVADLKKERPELDIDIGALVQN
ncbi:MAG: c-type cytochrome domain-containing protein [Bacteroidota bacterium]